MISIPALSGVARVVSYSGHEDQQRANAALIVWLRNNAQHYLSLMDEVERRNRQIASLFDAIKHGDQQHQDWLHEAIAQHFAGETK